MNWQCHIPRIEQRVALEWEFIFPRINCWPRNVPFFYLLLIFVSLFSFDTKRRHDFSCHAPLSVTQFLFFKIIMDFSCSILSFRRISCKLHNSFINSIIVSSCSITNQNSHLFLAVFFWINRVLRKNKMWIIIIDMWVKEELTKFVFSANFCKYSDNNTFFQANFVSSSSAYIKLHGLLYSRLFKQSWDTYYCFPDRFANHPPSQNLTLFILIFFSVYNNC